MASLVFFEAIDKNWIRSRGQFEVIFGALYELYLDKSKAPDICTDLLPMLQRYLHYCWPEKYEEPDGLALDVLEFSQFPAAEKVEMLKATEHLLQDFVHDRLDPHLDWNWERKGDFISALRQLITLMREDIASSRGIRLAVDNKKA